LIQKLYNRKISVSRITGLAEYGWARLGTSCENLSFEENIYKRGKTKILNEYLINTGTIELVYRIIDSEKE